MPQHIHNTLWWSLRDILPDSRHFKKIFVQPLADHWAKQDFNSNVWQKIQTSQNLFRKFIKQTKGNSSIVNMNNKQQWQLALGRKGIWNQSATLATLYYFKCPVCNNNKNNKKTKTKWDTQRNRKVWSVDRKVILNRNYPQGSLDIWTY